MGCKDAVLPKLPLKNHTLISFKFEEITKQPYFDNLCLMRAIVFHLHATQNMEDETSKNFKLFIHGMDEVSAKQFQGVHTNSFPFVGNIC